MLSVIKRATRLGLTLARSKTFKWYRRDFEGEAPLVQFVSRYLDEGLVKAALAASIRPPLAFRPYAWGLQHPAVDPISSGKQGE